MANKNMSSRLLNMKFMQRAAASTPTASPTTPDSGRPSKRQRLSTDAVSPDVQAFQDAAAAEEAKRNAFIERAAAEAGETKWILSLHEDKPSNNQSPLRIVSAGYGAIDSSAPVPESEDDDDEEQNAGMAGRRSFGKFNKVVERQHNPDLSSSESESDSDSDSENDDSDEDIDDADQLIKDSRKQAADKVRAERKAQKKQDADRAKQMADRRRSREVNLNKVGGISNATIKAKQGIVANMACHVCGQKGHLQRDCPDSKQRKRDRARS